MLSKNGGFLDVRWDDLISMRGLMLRPHPKQMVLEGISVTPQDDRTEFAAVLQQHECSCWQCRPEQIPALEEHVGIVSVRAWVTTPRFWKTTLDKQPCGFVKEAKPGKEGYVWLARTPPHACSCKSGYMCTTVLRGNVTIEPDGNE